MSGRDPLLYMLLIVMYMYGAVQGQSPGSYTTVRPSTIIDPPLPVVTANIKGPVLTTDWCASLAFSDTSENMFAHPLAFRCTRNGLILGYTNETVAEPNYYFTPFNQDVRVTLDGITPGNAAMDNYTDWSVRVAWDGGKLKATLAHGSPFAYFDATGTMKVTFLAKPVIWYGKNGVLGITVGTRHYGLFAPSSAEWNTTAEPFSVSLGNNGYCSIAALPDTDSATIVNFRRFAYNFIADTRIGWQYDRAAARVVTTFTASFIAREEGGASSLLFALYPHQWKFYSGKLSGITYNSVRGAMKVIEATSFVTSQPYTGILPHLPLVAKDGENGYKQALLEEYIATEAAKGSEALVRVNEDTYWTGKDLGRVAQLVRIADQLGTASTRDKFLTVLKARLEDWLTFTDGETSECFYYHKAWGTLIGAKPSYDSDKSLNDHHFHYGYFIYAAATVAQYDREWAEVWKPMVDLVIRDCNSPLRSDTLFPFLRAFDPYAGHSWASGNALFTSGNNQESTSEAINFAVGTALWGMATGDTLLRDLGIFLFTTEKNALLEYWFDIDNTIFPASYNHTMVGIVWGDKAAYETWFSAQPECIHGINMLPVTAASLYLGCSSAYVTKNFAEIEANNGGPVDQWHDVLWEYLALGTPVTAVKKLTATPAYTPEDGETRAHTYHWIHNLAVLGTVDYAITADAASTAVFDNGNLRRYVIWNPDDEVCRVSFSDGKVCTVPAHTLTAINAGDMAGAHYSDNGHWYRGGNGTIIGVRQQGNTLRLTLAPHTESSVTIKVFDMQGKLVRTIMATGRELRIENLPRTGVYVIATDEGGCRHVIAGMQ